MPKVFATIFADDIRQEVNGKLILIGVYGGQMVVGQFPFRGNIQLALIIDGAPSSLKKITLRLASKSGAVFGGGQLGLQHTTVSGVPESRTAMFPVPPIAITLSSPDTVQVWVAVNDQSDQLAGELDVIQGKISDVIPST